MEFTFEERLSDSPLIDTIWRTQSEDAGTFLSKADVGCQLVIARQADKTTITLRGPETVASSAQCPAHADFFGINFRLGTFMPHLPACQLVDGEVDLPEATRQTFWLKGATWELPNFENADTFINRLARAEILVHDPVVDAALQGHARDLSVRSVQRRFLRATGLTQGELCQIERAKQAALLLARGVSILDTVDQAGYADQPHLTRSLKRFLGQTPAQLIGVKMSA